MDVEGKSKRFRLNFDGKELALFVGGIAVICLLLFLYGLNVGRNRALQEARTRIVHQAPLPLTQRVEPAGGERMETSTRLEERKEGAVKESAEEKEAEAGKTDLNVSELTFYQTLPDKEAPPQNRPLTKGPKTGKVKAEPVGVKEIPKREAAPPPAADVQAERETKPSAVAKGPAGAVYSVQVSSFRDWARAMALKKKLVGSGYVAYVVQSKSGAGGSWFRVRVGSFRVKKEAEEVARKLGKEERLPAFAVLVDAGEAR
jgi:cell division protein FtsN